MERVTIEYAKQILQRSNEVNRLQELVQRDNLRFRNARWRRLEENHAPNFPHPNLGDLRDIPIGVHQINLAPSYIQDTLRRNQENELQIDTLQENPDIIRLRVFSRYRNAIRHQLFNQCDNILITGYYCT